MSFCFRFAKARTAERYEGEKVIKNDILGHMIARGMSQQEAESETILAT